MLAPPWTGGIPDFTAVFAFAHLVELMAAVTILVVAVFAALLVRLTRARHEFWVVRCPEDGERALVRFHVGDDGRVDTVASCSRLGVGVVPTCHRGCVPKAA